jgi:S-DNA-T family DNA segregation ATPase FtsK/SpoIIIE
MTITLTVSEVRQALQRANGRFSHGTGTPSTALLGTIFHRVVGELLRDDSMSNLETVLRDREPDIDGWKNLLLERTYDELLGPLLTSHSAALRDHGEQVMGLWKAVQNVVSWLAELWWQITEGGTISASQSDWFWVERPVVLDLQQSNWSKPVALIGQTDAVLRYPKNNAWCVLEWKIGQTSPVIDLAQVCLYHLMINGTNPVKSSSALAVVSFLPERRETLFQSAQIAEAQSRLMDLIGCLAGVMPEMISTRENSSINFSGFVRTADEAIHQIDSKGQISAETLTRSASDNAAPAVDGLAPISAVTAISSIAIPRKPSVTIPGSTAPTGPSSEWLSETRDRILRVLRRFGVPCRESKPPVCGPCFVRFSVFPDGGIKQKKVLSGAPELHLHLGLPAEPVMSVIDGAIAIDLPSPNPESVTFDDLRPLLPLVDPIFGCSQVPVGLDLNRTLVWCDLAASESPHMLVVGTSGSGKSQWLRTTVASLMATNTPETLQLLLIDPKQNAFTFAGASAFLRQPILVPDGELCVSEILLQLVNTMEERYMMFAANQSQSMSDFVRSTGHPMPRIVCICDEYADLLESSDRTERQAIEKQLRRISAKGRAAGIHLILATQQPRATVITPAIRAMLPAKVALRVTDARESRIAIDDPGAERLLGNGDLLFRSIGTQRLQGAWLPDEQAQTLDNTTSGVALF